MFPTSARCAAASASAGSKRLSVIAECKKRQIPAVILETPKPDEFGAIHYEERRLLGSSTGALQSYHR